MGVSSAGVLSHHRRRSSGQSAPPPPAPPPVSSSSPNSSPAAIEGRDEQHEFADDEAESPSDDWSPSDDLVDEMDYLSSDDDLHDDEETGLTIKQRRQLHRRRYQRRQLDARIAGAKAARSLTRGFNLADRTVIKRLFVNAILISMWYFFSLAISIVSMRI